MKLTLKNKQDPEYLESKITSLKTSCGCQIEEKFKIAAIVKAGGKHYAADIHIKTRAIKKGWWLCNECRPHSGYDGML